jgi:hypothetical protein
LPGACHFLSFGCDKMKIRNKFIIVILIAIIFCAIFAAYALDRGSEDDGNNVSFVIDEDDVSICQAEKFERAAMSSYDARADLFLKKALSNDDRDGDGISTLDNCLNALRGRCPSGTDFSSFVLSYLQENFKYVSDQELYSSFDWAAYPIETLSLKAGDCEDFVILFVALLERGGYDCGIALFHDHAVAMVAVECDTSSSVDGFSPMSVEYGGQTYYTFETTENCPPGYTFEEYSSADILSFKIVSA